MIANAPIVRRKLSQEVFDRLVERIRSLLVAPPHEAVATLVGLVEDTHALAAEHVPGADVTALRDAFELRRVVEA